VEPLGSEQLVHLRGESGTLIARFDPKAVIHPGDEIELAVDIDQGHIFNRETDEAVF
jgi:multiple sugar transport system ATP-binding protein